MELVDSLVSLQPALRAESDALKSMKQRYSGVKVFYVPDAGGTTPQVDTVMQNLPKWCSLRCQRLLRQVMEGRKDAALMGLCSSPPKGGLQAVRYDPDIAQCKGFAEAIADLKSEFEKWSAERQGKEVPATCKEKQEESKESKETTALTPNADAEHQCPELDKLRGELTVASKEVRMAHASILVLPTSHLAITHAVTGSAAYKQSSREGSDHRVALVYAIPCSWDAPRPSDGKQDRRANYPLPLWVEDFESFVAVASEVVTPENQNHAVVFMGRTKRMSAGLASEAGLAIENQIIECFKKVSKGPAWRMKRITMVMANPRGRSRGVCGASGSRLEVVFFFFRGVWPSKRKARNRELVSGTTSDDVWMDIPDVAFDSVAQLPYVVKKSILQETAWAAISVATPLGAEHEEDHAQSVSSDEGAKSKKRKDVEGGKDSEKGKCTEDKTSKKCTEDKTSKKCTEDKTSTKGNKKKQGKKDKICT